jgi:glutamate formiminotransferase
MRPDRMRLEDVRKGQFEGLREAVRRDSSRHPDVGLGELHPTAGAVAVGARQFLIAYNIYLDTADLHAARAIAKELRASSGGMVGVKAMGVLVDGRAQVSFNITDFQATPVATLHAAVCRLAARMGVGTAEGELIGLVPAAACVPTNVGETMPEWLRQTNGFHPDEKILEHRLKQPMIWPEPLSAAHV